MTLRENDLAKSLSAKLVTKSMIMFETELIVMIWQSDFNDEGDVTISLILFILLYVSARGNVHSEAAAS